MDFPSPRFSFACCIEEEGVIEFPSSTGAILNSNLVCYAQPILRHLTYADPSVGSKGHENQSDNGFHFLHILTTSCSPPSCLCYRPPTFTSEFVDEQSMEMVIGYIENLESGMISDQIGALLLPLAHSLLLRHGMANAALT